MTRGGKERRAQQRHRVRLRVRWGRDSAEELEAEVADLSPAGCFVKSLEPVGEGDLVKLTFEIPGGRGCLTVWGNVVYRATGKGFGLRFSAFSRGGGGDALREMLYGG